MKLVLTRLELLEAVESYWGRRKTGRQVEVTSIGILILGRPTFFDCPGDTFEFEATPIDETDGISAATPTKTDQ